MKTIIKVETGIKNQRCADCGRIITPDETRMRASMPKHDEISLCAMCVINLARRMWAK